ncbi:ABC transporter permease, partial [Streptomyces sp. NPDC059604]
TAHARAGGGRARAGRGRWAARLAGRLPLPRPVALGLTRPFARPARALAMGAAILFGTRGLSLSVGVVYAQRRVLEAHGHREG